MPPRATTEFQAAQVRLALMAVLSARSEWRRMPDDFDRGWLSIGPRLAALVAAAQFRSARDAAEYVPAVLAEQGQPVSADAQVVAAAFAGLSAIGSPLEGFLRVAVIRAKATAGDSAARLAVGERWLAMATQSAVADAGRDAALTSVVARPDVKFVRIATRCCSRCAVLDGRVYRYSQGFQRHPRCDCTMQPRLTDVGPEPLDHSSKPGDFLPPSRVQRLAAHESRDEATAALVQAGYLAA